MVVAVDPTVAGSQLRRDAMRLLDIARPDARREPINAVVGFRNQLIRVFEGNRRDHRPEDFLPYDLHVFVGVYQHGGLHEITLVALTSSAHDRIGAFREAGLEGSTEPVQLLVRYQ